ncbi:futalosine hydrolase [Paenibacillus sacheonensis]|uniref:Futalosine hydrolase n=1 Tax=Paenibacillus sacheonensis TaxID=742054 RepID=A0A7X4YQJ0_9BACL|nr:futalosine hydrolase [Paenibacillus sacheonensis]MBM7566679.1 futalosine hydrolase [Paenibacillus sacheonensis]NBC70660.1 futalosine hydrolase [Paenibacillus sacheonensis]
MQNRDRTIRGRVLVVTAVDAEREAVLRGVAGDDRFHVIAAGVGPASAAAGTAFALAAGGAAAADADRYALVVSAGIAGGFPGRAAVGSIVVASDIIAADLGAETPDGFASVDELGFGSARIAADARIAGALAAGIAAAGLPVSLGPVLTVSTATGSAHAAAEHERRVPGAAAEAMEGFGAATAARQLDLPALELRAISNAVGPRDRSAWRIGDALQALERASQILKEVLE